MASRETAQAAGLMAGFYNTVQNTMLNMGGTHAHMAMLAQESAHHAIALLAETAIKEFPIVFDLVGEPETFGEGIEAGQYDEVQGFAAPGEQYFAAIGDPTKVGRRVRFFKYELTKRILIAEMYEKFRNQMAGLFELLLFGSSHPKIQLLLDVHAIWRDAKGNYWYGALYSVNGSRCLDIEEVPNTATCPGIRNNDRILVLA